MHNLMSISQDNDFMKHNTRISASLVQLVKIIDDAVFQVMYYLQGIVLVLNT